MWLFFSEWWNRKRSAGASTRTKALSDPNRNPNPANTLNTWLVGMARAARDPSSIAFGVKHRIRSGWIRASNLRSRRMARPSRKGFKPLRATAQSSKVTPIRCRSIAAASARDTTLTWCRRGLKKANQVGSQSFHSPRGVHHKGDVHGSSVGDLGTCWLYHWDSGQGRVRAREVGGCPAIWRPGCLDERRASESASR